MATILELVRAIIDETGGSTFWTTPQLYDAINQAQLRYNTLPIANDQFSVIANDDLIPIDTTSIMIPKYVTDDVTNEEYAITSHTRLEQYSREWRGSSLSKPKFFILWDASTLRVYPRPSTTYLYHLYGLGWPSEVSDASPDIVVDRALKRAIAYHASGLLLEFTQPLAAEQLHKDGETEMSRYRLGIRNSQSSRIWRIAPGTKTTAILTGDIALGKNFLG